jgi:hypothetical protein
VKTIPFHARRFRCSGSRLRAALLTVTCAAHAAADPVAKENAEARHAPSPVVSVPSAHSPGPSAAQTERARQHYARALQLYDAGAEPEALREFESAYAIMGDARLLFNIGQLEFSLQHHPRARRSLEQYLREAKGISDERRADVLQQLQVLDPLTRSEEKVVAADRRPLALKAESPSRPAEMSTGAAAAWISSGVLGLGALSTALATVLASRRHSELRSSRSAPEGAAGARAKLDRQRELVQHLAIATDVLALAAIGSAGLGLYFTLSGDGGDPPGLSVEVGAAQLRVTGSF